MARLRMTVVVLCEFHMDRYLSVSPSGDSALPGGDTETFDQAHCDAALDEALCCTFPASDPIAINFAFTPLVLMRAELIRRAFPRTLS